MREGNDKVQHRHHCNDYDDAVRSSTRKQLEKETELLSTGIKRIRFSRYA